jgi:hypothetical protein
MVKPESGWPSAWAHRAGHPYCHELAGDAATISGLSEITEAHGPMVSLWAWQDERCALCGGQIPLGVMVADHCHDSGMVRGLLCAGCNALAGHGRVRDPRQARALQRYLDRPPTQMLGFDIAYRDHPRWRRSLCNLLKALETAPTETPSQVEVEDVRCTVDLSPVAFRELRDWRNETADLSGWSRVTNQDVLAVLVDLLLTDEAIAGQVRAKLPDTASGSKAASRAGANVKNDICEKH